MCVSLLTGVGFGHFISGPVCLWCKGEMSCTVQEYILHCSEHLRMLTGKRAIGHPRRMVVFDTCQCQELDSVESAFSDIGVEHECWDQQHWHPIWAGMDCAACPVLLRIMSLVNPFHSLNETTMQLLARHLPTQVVSVFLLVYLL